MVSLLNAVRREFYFYFYYRILFLDAAETLNGREVCIAKRGLKFKVKDNDYMNKS